MNRIAFLVAALALPASPAFSWGATGHRVTGAIAEQHLSGRARAHVRLILGDESLAEASTWADEMRANPAEFWQRTAGPWHYVTVPPGRTYPELCPPEQGDAATALRRFARTLRNPDASPEEKRLALRFTIHLIGDLHQPLHAGSGKDRGGNDVKVTFFGDETNLHSVWDSGLVEHKKLSYSEYAAWLSRRTTAGQVIAWWDPDPLTWIEESAALRETLYPEEAALSWSYAYRHTPALELRLQQAGIRTAAYLDRIFSDLPTTS